MHLHVVSRHSMLAPGRTCSFRLQNGRGGTDSQGFPQLDALMYDPDLPKGKRFTAVAARTNIMRPYHGNGCIVSDGTVLVIGSDGSFNTLPGVVRGNALLDWLVVAPG